MKKAILFLTAVLILCAAAHAAVEMPGSSYLKGLTWKGHDTFRLEREGVVLYVDPWRIEGEPKDGDIILITHPHFDHCEPKDIFKVLKPGAVIVTVEEAAQKLKEGGVEAAIQILKPGENLEIGAVMVEAVPAYNINKEFHPQTSQWVGFIVAVDEVRIYHAGDTDFIPEMKDLRVDVALLPVSGTYVMTADEAAEAAKAIRPKVAVPMHYGTLVGTEADARRFQELCSEMIVEVLKKE
ncbi:MAG: MBL fold metallo-hydrolase [Candidatus Omnitrophica bacterium]|nr:MBL fold metallo-hydrolase [Candidatus Omnitrophota bacterium]